MWLWWKMLLKFGVIFEVVGEIEYDFFFVVKVRFYFYVLGIIYFIKCGVVFMVLIRIIKVLKRSGSCMMCCS